MRDERINDRPCVGDRRERAIGSCKITGQRWSRDSQRYTDCDSGDSPSVIEPLICKSEKRGFLYESRNDRGIILFVSTN